MQELCSQERAHAVVMSSTKLACGAEPRAGPSPLVTWRDATSTDGPQHPEMRVSIRGWTAPGAPAGSAPDGSAGEPSPPHPSASLLSSQRLLCSGWTSATRSCFFESAGKCLVEEGLMVLPLQVLLLQKMLGFGQPAALRYIVIVRKRVRIAVLQQKLYFQIYATTRSFPIGMCWSLWLYRPLFLFLIWQILPRKCTHLLRVLRCEIAAWVLRNLYLKI